jgi:hypothetical protein
MIPVRPLEETLKHVYVILVNAQPNKTWREGLTG